MSLCGEPHPDHQDILCDKEAPCWAYHANAPASLVWEGAQMPQRVSERSSGSSMKAQLAMMASRAR